MRTQVRNSEIIGRQIYILDKVSAIATDVLREKVPSFHEKNLAGYLPFREAGDDLRPKDSYLVMFFTKEEPLHIAYEIRLKPDAAPEFEAFDPPKPALPSFVHMAKARQAAVAALPSHPQPINPLILPAELLGEKGMMVYLIAGTTKPDAACVLADAPCPGAKSSFCSMDQSMRYTSCDKGFGYALDVAQCAGCADSQCTPGDWVSSRSRVCRESTSAADCVFAKVGCPEGKSSFCSTDQREYYSGWEGGFGYRCGSQEFACSADGKRSMRCKPGDAYYACWISFARSHKSLRQVGTTRPLPFGYTVVWLLRRRRSNVACDRRHHVESHLFRIREVDSRFHVGYR
jgi:hypothetical protein